MIISDLDYLYSIAETDAMDLNGGDAVATSTAVASASGSATATKINFTLLTVSKDDFLLAYSSTRATSSSSRGSASSYSSSSAYVSPSA